VKRDERRWLLLTAILLLAASVGFYLIDYLLFHDARTIFLYLFIDLGFLPIEVLLVGLILERLLRWREASAVQHKLNMVVGAFFSEAGNELLGRLTPAVVSPPDLRERLNLKAAWTKRDFAERMTYVRSVDAKVDLDRLDLEELRTFLVGRRDFLVRLLENPGLLERDHFTDVLWAVFHLTEELEARDDLTLLPPTDRLHLAGDAKRVYGQLAAEWLAYAQHLKETYPFLFSLVVRTHPFQAHPSATVVS